MINLRRLFALWRARNREFFRDRSSLSWNIVFPVFIVVGFTLAFSGGTSDIYKVGVLGERTDHPFFDTDYIDFIDVSDNERAERKVSRHQLDLLIAPQSKTYWFNDTSPKGYILERVLKGSGADEWQRQVVRGEQIRYVDWLIPGVLGMNMMFSALFGVGYVIVRYRKNGVLKRLKATPLSALEFLLSQILSRLWIIVAVTSTVYIGTNLFVDFAMEGSYLDLVVVLFVATMSLISLGLLVAARGSSEEMAGGLLNMMSWPMMFLSGVWFSLEGLNPWIQKLAQIFPLTHAIDAARAIMIDGASLMQVSHHLLILLAMTALFLVIGSRLFRWE